MPKNQLIGQKFKIGDKVLRKNIFGTTKITEKRIGVIYGVKTKENKEKHVNIKKSVKNKYAQTSLLVN